MTEPREQRLQQWVAKALSTDQVTLTVASADASFRRYLRVQHGGISRVVMDAPPEHEDCGPFVRIAVMLRQAGVNAPKVHSTNTNDGFLLLDDHGDRLYSHALTVDSADHLYSEAMDALVDIQSIGPVDLPAYDRALLDQEMALFRDWLLVTHLGLKLSSEECADLQVAFSCLAESALQQPQVFVHRDYHCRNLMVLDTDSPGVLDFQDAVHGPITYDLVSLLRDCYVRWPNAWVLRWSEQFRARVAPETTPETWQTWFDLMGMQRHLKAAGIFARLNHRDGKPGYLADVPRTVQYIVEAASRHQQFEPLAQLIRQRVLPALQSSQRAAG